MTLYDTVISNLKGVIGSKKEGVLVSHLDSEYNAIIGESIPLRKLGYDTLYEFLQSQRDLFGVQGTGKFCRVLNVVGNIENDSTLNLINLIQNTQIKYKKRSSNLRSGYKGQNYQHNYKSSHHNGYQSSYNPYYQSSYNPGHLTSYNPGHQSPYNNSYSNGHNITTPTASFGFTNNSNFNFTFTNNFKPSDKKTDETFPVVASKHQSFYQHPNAVQASNNLGSDSKQSKLLVPIKCLMRAQKSPERANVLVISDDEDTELIQRPNISTQTPKHKTINPKRLFVSLQSLELVNMLIDVIIEYKMLRFNEVLKVRVDADLYCHFCQYSGLNIDPILFCDYVQLSLNLSKTKDLYKDLIYLDPSESICMLNMKSVCNTKMQLPDFEFDYKNEYIVEIVKTFHDNLVGFKVPVKLNSHLTWKKNMLPDKTKEMIESQHFWSWIPGTLCLVQLPTSIVKKLNLSPVERAVILFTEIATLPNISLQNAQRYLIHKTSFYLIDHEKEVENLYSCASSFHEIKQNAKENNNIELTFVCNMSLSARNTPSKIQFAKLENYKDVSKNFLDENNQLKPNAMLVLRSLKKMTLIFHFQSMYSCASRFFKVEEKSRVLNNYSDIAPVISEHKEVVPQLDVIHRKKVDQSELSDYSEIIVISDDDDDIPASKPLNKVASNAVKSALSLNEKPEDSHQAKNKDFLFQNKIIMPLLENIPLPKYEKKAPRKEKEDPLPHKKIQFRFEQTKPTTTIRHNGIDKLLNSHKVDCLVTSTPNLCKKNNQGANLIETHLEGDLAKMIISAKKNSLNHKHKGEVFLPASIISYLENNSNPDIKCLRPLTTDKIDIFDCHVVKLLHIQMGSAVLMLFDSVKMMKMKIKMLQLKKQNLQTVKNVSIGGYFIWHNEIESGDRDDNLLVEVMRLLTENRAVVNIVHRGLLMIVNIDELFCIPGDKSCDESVNLDAWLGPSVGTFNLHLFPDWYTPSDTGKFSNQLFTAFFTEDGKLVLEYFEEPCRFLNLEIIESIERSLTINHCNVKSRNFIELLSRNLLQCRHFVGAILQMMEFNNGMFDDLSINKVLCKVTAEDKKEVWFASVLVRSDCAQECYEKLSPHNFMRDEFCVDRVQYDDRRHSLHLLEYHNISIEVPDNYEGLYRFDRRQLRGILTSNDEFWTRYMLSGASCTPDLKYLCNKLIFDVRPF